MRNKYCKVLMVFLMLCTVLCSITSVYADEPTEEVEQTEIATEPEQSATEEVSGDTIIVPPYMLPVEGFEWIVDENGVTIETKSNKDDVAIKLYDNTNASMEYCLFFGNLETKNITACSAQKNEGFLAALHLDPGYYVVFNYYAWIPENGDGNKAYAPNGGSPIYLYVGNSFDENKYEGTDFIINGEDIISIEIKEQEVFPLKNINFGTNISQEMLDAVEAIPDAFLLNVNTNQPGTDTGNPETDDDADENTEDPNVTEKELGLFERFIKQSWLSLSLIVIILIMLFVIKQKKQIALQKQREKDQYDENSIE